MVGNSFSCSVRPGVVEKQGGAVEEYSRGHQRTPPVPSSVLLETRQWVGGNWCNTVVVRESWCSPSLELLSASLRPFYVLREFPQLSVTLVLPRPWANAVSCSNDDLDTVPRLPSITPEASNLMMTSTNLERRYQSVFFLPETGNIWPFVMGP